MVRLRTGFRTYSHGILVRGFHKFSERRKPIIVSQWPPESSEDDEDENEPASKKVVSSSDHDVTASEDNGPRAWPKQIIDLSSEEDDSLGSGDDKAPPMEIIDLSLFEDYEPTGSRDDEAPPKQITNSSSEDNEAPSEEDIRPSLEDYAVPPWKKWLMIHNGDSGDDEASPKQIIDLSSEDDELSDSGDDEAPPEKDIKSSSEDEMSASEDDEPPPVNNQGAPENKEPPDAQGQPWEPANSFSHRRLVAKGSINGKNLDALADSGASFNVISQELVGTLGLTIDQTSAVSVCLPSGATIRTLGKVSGVFNFSDEENSYPLLCMVLEKCVHPLVLGSQFLRVTQTLTKYTSRITNVFSNILGLNFLAVLEAEQCLLDGYLNGQAADIVPDTGSDIMVMSLLFAEQLGLTVHDGPEHRIKVQFIDGSEAYTIGRVRGVKWRFQRYLDWGKHTLRRDGYEFHIIQNLPVDAIVSNDFIAKVGVFKNHTHRLVSRRPEKAHTGIYGIRYIESKRAHKKEQTVSRSQYSSAEMEESELHRRDAAEEDIEELLLTDPVAAESKRLEEQERRRAQDQHKRRYDEARLASIPQTATINTGGIALPAQHSSTEFSLQNTSLTQQSAHALYQSQAGAATAASFDVESGRPQAKRRRLELPRWLIGSR